MSGQQPAPPSATAPSTRVHEQPQQASTSPGDGTEQVGGEELGIPWKDQVIGYAKQTRGTLLGKQETKEEGKKILEGEVVPSQTHKDA